MAYTATEGDRQLLRRNLGDTGTTPAFSDDEIAALLVEAGGDQDVALRQGLWELLAQGARWHDYTTDVEQEKKSQVFDHLQTLYGVVEGRIAAREAEGRRATRRPARSVALKVSGGW